MGAIGHDGLAVPGQVELAHEPAFALGAVHVDPATRQVVAGGRSETVEPRVMQVLVALARAEGRVITRDELILWCWGGRIVGDDAINRVIARIRQIAADIGQASFSVETITKVGYRLTVHPHGDAVTEPRPPAAGNEPTRAYDRRAWLAGAALTTAGAAGLLWLAPWRHRPPEEAGALFRRAEIAWKAGLPDQARQAVYYLERAVRIDPRYSQAWGALAVAYTHLLDGYGEAEMASVPGRIRSAARRAMDLDPDNGDARLALASIQPSYRNWAAVERDLRGLGDRYPRLWLAHGRLAFMLYQVGRLSEGIDQHRKVLALDPMIPLPYAAIARALSDLGRVQEADEVIDDARRRWPAHPMIWNVRFYHLLFSGRPQSAIAAAMDPDSRPSGFGPEMVEYRLRLARAVDSHRPAEIAAIIEEERQAALMGAGSIPMAASIFSLLGRTDLAFDALDRYFLDRGTFGTPAAIGPYTRRYTDLLFSQAMAPARADGRFAPLLADIGLESYWRESGRLPDYRRA